MLPAAALKFTGIALLAICLVCGLVATADDAVQQANETHPDLILMDIRLKGGTDGIAAARQIQARLGTPVVYLTAYADERTLQRAKLTEPFGYLVKPFDQRELHTTIETALYRHEMEVRLRESEAHLSTILKSIGDAIIATDLEGRVMFMNPVAEALTGWQREEALGQDLQAVFYIVNREIGSPIECPVTRALRDQAVVGLEKLVWLVTKDGAQVPIDDSAAPIWDDQGNITGAVLAFRDVTERVLAEEEIRRRNQELTVLNRVIAASAAGLAPESLLDRACRELARAFDLPRARAVLLNEAKTSAEVVAAYPAEGRPSTLDQAIPVIGNTVFEHLLAHKAPLAVDAGSTPHLVRARPLTDDSRPCPFVATAEANDYYDGPALRLVFPILIHGQVVGLLELSADEPRRFSPRAVGLACSVIKQVAGALARTWSEERRRQLEEQYHQGQKMEALGRLTGGVAHEFNNLLTVMNGFTELLQMELLPDSPLTELTDKIHRSGQRAANLVRQLLAFSRTQIIEPQVADLNLVVAEMHDMLSRIIGEHIRMETDLAPDLWPVKVDLAQLELALVNLVVNARDAMPDGGRLTLETANLVLDHDDVSATDVSATVGLLPGAHVLLAISDTGVGMSEGVKARVFEPFFTTKEIGQGTGLGLATVHGIIRQSGGDIVCTSQEGVGTTFKIYLPRAEETVGARIGRAMKTDMPRGTETLLLVEDDGDVRDMAGRVLQNQGYTLLEAGDGQEALEIAHSHPEPIHLLLTDLVMPIMNGKSLAGQLVQAYPDIKILFTSGYPGETIARHGLLEPGVNFLQKPFSPKDLAWHVRRALDSRP